MLWQGVALSAARSVSARDEALARRVGQETAIALYTLFMGGKVTRG